MARQIDDNNSPFKRAVMEGLTGSDNESTISIGKRRGSPYAGDALAWIPAFLDALAEGESITGASRIAGVHPTLVHRRRKDDEEFRRAWCQAAEVGTRLMEQEAQRRAFHGTLKPVFQKGVCVGHQREYSDTLMIFLLKARRPDKYRDGIECTGHSNVNINIFDDIERDIKRITVVSAADSSVQAHGDAEPVDAAQPNNSKAASEASGVLEALRHA